MVDRNPFDFGKGLLGEASDNSDYKVKETTRKRRRPEVSPHIKDRIATLLPEDVAESPVRKFLKQFEYSDPEGMPKNNSKANPNSPSKSDSSAADMDKNKK